MDFFPLHLVKVIWLEANILVTGGNALGLDLERWDCAWRALHYKIVKAYCVLPSRQKNRLNFLLSEGVAPGY